MVQTKNDADNDDAYGDDDENKNGNLSSLSLLFTIPLMSSSG